MADAADRNFAAHNFETDEDWKEYRRNITIPPDREEGAVIFKLKQKYFRSKVNPDYVIKPVPTSSSIPPPSSNASRTSPARPTAESAPGRSEPTGPSQTSRVPNIQLLATSLFFVNVMVFLSCFLFVVPLMGHYHAYKSFRRALLCSMLSCALKLVEKFGTPRLGTVRKLFDKDAMRPLIEDVNAHYLMYSFLFLGVRPTAVPLMPIILRSVYQLAYTARAVLGTSYPSLYSRLDPLVQWLTARTSAANRYRAVAEVSTLGLLIVELFTPSRSPLVLLMYFHFLILRYQTNNYSAAVLSQLGHLLDRLAYHPRAPLALRNLYGKARGFVYPMFNPPQQRQR